MGSSINWEKAAFSSPEDFPDGTNALVEITCDPALDASGKFRGKITVTYQKKNSDLDLTSTGQLVDSL